MPLTKSCDKYPQQLKIELEIDEYGIQSNIYIQTPDETFATNSKNIVYPIHSSDTQHIPLSVLIRSACSNHNYNPTKINPLITELEQLIKELKTHNYKRD